MAIAAKFPWANYKTFVDVGGAQGGTPVVVAQAHPHLTGANFVIDQTEALVAIDVNSGKFTSLQSQAETIKLTNLEACKEIARQLRLRNIGGMIVRVVTVLCGGAAQAMRRTVRRTLRRGLDVAWRSRAPRKSCSRDSSTPGRSAPVEQGPDGGQQFLARERLCQGRVRADVAGGLQVVARAQPAAT